MIDNNTRGYAGPSKYLQGEFLLENLAQYTLQYGKKPMILIDVFFYKDYCEKFEKSYQLIEQPVCIHKFEGEITIEKINEYVKQAEALGVDVVVGIGGGKTLDSTKAVAQKLGDLPVVISPTTAATDAPCSAMSVIYNLAGEQTQVIYQNSNPNLVLVDTAIIAKAPVRFLVAGMGDSLATYYEGRANIESNSPNYVGLNNGGGYKRTLLAKAVAKSCYKVILAEGLKAKNAAEMGITNEAFEDVVEANTLLSGIGFENMACAAAHSVGTGIGHVKHKAGTLHGEKVAFGILCQLHLENRCEKEIYELMDFFYQVGLPITLSDLEISTDDETINAIAQGSFPECWSSQPQVITFSIIAAAIKAADNFGKKYYAKLK